MSRYAKERADLRTPLCRRSPFLLRFNGRSLQELGSKMSMLFRAVSGKPDEKGRFDRSAQRQRIRKQGPIPAGNHWVQPSQLWDNNWLESALRLSRNVWGNFRLTIHFLSKHRNPWPRWPLHSRWHDTTQCGCIDLALNTDRFVERFKQE